MPIPPRILRDDIENIPGARPKLSSREYERCETILAAGRRVMVLHGRAGIRLTDLATALSMSPVTLRRYFPDLDCLLAEILRTHVLATSSAIGRAVASLPPGAPQRQPAAREAYLEATRTILGGQTEAHLLLLRECHSLPEDMRGAIEHTRACLGEMLAGELGETALGLLDMPYLSGAQIETMLRALVRPERATPRLHIVSRPDHPGGRIKRNTACMAGLGGESGACAASPKAPPTQPYATADP